MRWERTVEPNAGNRAAYDEARDRWTEAYAAQKKLVDAGVTQSMWRAPGA